jgi:hypothetical protein
MAYDTLLGYLDGSLRYADSPSTIYVAEIKGHPEFLKIGFCQLAFRKQRRADPYISAIVYESCTDHETTLICGDMPRAEAFLIEQYLHETLTSHRELIPELDEAKWSGRYETFRIKPSARAHFLDWLNFEVGSLRIHGTDSLEQMLDQLVSTAEETELYELLKEQWAKDRAERLARIKKTRAPRKRRAAA